MFDFKKLFQPIKKWWLRRTYARVQKLIVDSGDRITERERCMAMLGALKTSQFENFQSMDATGVTVSVPYDSIGAYTTALLKAAKDHKEYRMVSAVTRDNMKDVALNQFFVTANGNYQNVHKAITQLRTAGLELCTALDNTDDAEFGVSHYNRRATTVLLVNLRALITTLAEVSLVG